MDSSLGQGRYVHHQRALPNEASGIIGHQPHNQGRYVQQRVITTTNEFTAIRGRALPQVPVRLLRVQSHQQMPQASIQRPLIDQHGRYIPQRITHNEAGQIVRTPVYYQRVITGGIPGVRQVMPVPMRRKIINHPSGSNEMMANTGYTEVNQPSVLQHPQMIQKMAVTPVYIPPPTTQDTLPSMPAPLPPPPVDDSNIDIHIRNVVCNYSLPMHIDLRKFALNSWNCAYDRAGTVLMKQKRKPNCHVKIYSSGKVYIVGCKSEAESYKAARSIGREIQQIMGKTSQRVRLQKWRVNNIMATCKLNFGILIHEINRQYPKESYYEPELTVGLIWRMTEPKASVRIYSTGTITVTGATSENDVALAIEKIYEVVKNFRCDLRSLPPQAARKRASAAPIDPSIASAPKCPRANASAQDMDDEEDGEHVMWSDEENIDELI